MSEETTPQGEAAISHASAGEPDAWMHVSGGLSLGVFRHVDKRLRHLCVPLYRSPTLTDAEREAIEAAILTMKQAASEVRDDRIACETLARLGRSLRGLLERLG